MKLSKKTRKFARQYATASNCDIILCNSPIDFSLERSIRQKIQKKKTGDNVLIVPTTLGGRAEIAYRIGRLLQRSYKKVTVCIAGWCKSAGTLLAVCGHDLVMSDNGELGPFDVQLLGKDDLWSRTSGLVETSAFAPLEEISWSLLQRFVREIKNLPGGHITFKTATEVAAPLVASTLSPIYAQIDPLKLGETSRALKIASTYADRLNYFSRNLKSDGAAKLVSGYPDHSFVIDREETEDLFVRVTKPCGMLNRILIDLWWMEHPAELFDGKSEVFMICRKPSQRSNTRNPNAKAKCSKKNKDSADDDG
ncbi:MAG: hypothetical protein OXG24_03615 [Gammaproteobacteria bacterium]|nr:hypothetical protein [Gammaproteobacteria bacterium]